MLVCVASIARKGRAPYEARKRAVDSREGASVSETDASPTQMGTSVPAAGTPVRTEIPEPRPSEEVGKDWERLSRWLLDEINDDQFARLLRTDTIDVYVGRIASHVTSLPREPGMPSPEMRAFLDRFNERVLLVESKIR